MTHMTRPNQTEGAPQNINPCMKKKNHIKDTCSANITVTKMYQEITQISRMITMQTMQPQGIHSLFSNFGNTDRCINLTSMVCYSSSTH